MIEKPLRPDPMDSTESDMDDIEVLLGDGMALDPEDGSIMVDLDAPMDEEIAIPAEIPHAANIAQYLSEAARRKLVDDLKMAADADNMARDEWLSTVKTGIELMGLKFETVSQPWPGAAAARHPLLAKAVVSFQSRSIKTLFPAAGPVKGKLRGATTPFKLKAMARAVEEMNHLMTEHQDYRNELEKALFMCGLTGSGFVKTWFSQEHRRPLSYNVHPEHVILSPDASDVTTAIRVTHIMREDSASVKRHMASGMYRECDLEEGDALTGSMSTDEINEVDDAKAEVAGIEAVKDQRLVLHEMQTRLDLSEYDEAFTAVDDYTAGPLPYMVTYDTHSGELLAVYRNWDEQDEYRMPLQRFTQYIYIVAFGPYGLGLVHLIGQTVQSATAALRNLLDTGTLSNLPGGFKTSGLRIENKSEPFRPGEYRDVSVASGTLRDNLVPHAFKEPSPTLLNLMTMMDAKGEELATVSSSKLDDIPHNAASFAVLAVLERELEPQAAVHVRLHSSLRRQLRMLSNHIRDDMPPDYEYDEGVSPGLRKTDFSIVEIIPVSNPNEASAGSKLMKMEILRQLAQAFPQQFDEASLVRYSVGLLGEPDFEGLMKPLDEPPPVDPVSENMNLLMGKPIKVYPEQDHEAHLRCHMAAMQDPKILSMVGQSPSAPAMMMAAQAHIAEHVAHAYRRGIEREMGAPLPPANQPMPPEIANQFSSLVADASERLLGLHQKLEALKMADDPVVAAQQQDAKNESRKLDIEEEDKREKRMLEGAKLALEANTRGITLTLNGLNTAAEIAQKIFDLDNPAPSGATNGLTNEPKRPGVPTPNSPPGV